MKRTTGWTIALTGLLASSTAMTLAQEAPDTERREVRRVLVMQDGGDLMRGAPGMQERRMGGVPHLLGRLGDELELTPQQRGKLTEHYATVQPQMRKLRGEIREQTRKLRDLSPDDPQFAAVSAETAKRVGELSLRLVQQSTDLRRKMWDELTPEQRTKWKTMQSRMAERRSMGGRRGGSMDGPMDRQEMRERVMRLIERRGDLPAPPLPPPR